MRSRCRGCRVDVVRDAVLRVTAPAVVIEHGGAQVDVVGVFLVVEEMIVLAVRALGIAQRLQEPRVFVGRAVEDEVEDDGDAALIALFDEPLEVLHRAVFGVDGVIVFDVVLVEGARGHDGQQPHPRDAEVVVRRRVAVVEIVELLDEPVDVAHAVAVRIGERIDEHGIPRALIGFIHIVRRGAVDAEGDRLFFGRGTGSSGLQPASASAPKSSVAAAIATERERSVSGRFIVCILLRHLRFLISLRHIATAVPPPTMRRSTAPIANHAQTGNPPSSAGVSSDGVSSGPSAGSSGPEGSTGRCCLPPR